MDEVWFRLSLPSEAFRLAWRGGVTLACNYRIRVRVVYCMGSMLAMGIPFTADDQGYLLRLAHTWQVFIPPLLALVAALIGWIFRRIHRASGPADRGPDLAAQRTEVSEQRPSGELPGTDWPFALQGS